MKPSDLVRNCLDGPKRAYKFGRRYLRLFMDDGETTLRGEVTDFGHCWYIRNRHFLTFFPSLRVPCPPRPSYPRAGESSHLVPTPGLFLPLLDHQGGHLLPLGGNISGRFQGNRDSTCPVSEIPARRILAPSGSLPWQSHSHQAVRVEA